MRKIVLTLLSWQQHYRHWIIWRCPSIRFLDYQKVKDVERAKATELFGTAKEPSALASKVNFFLPQPPSSSHTPKPLHPDANPPSPQQITGIKSRTFDIPSALASTPGDKTYRVKLTEKERKRVEGLIRNAKSLQEITRLEKELNEGRIPGGLAGERGDVEMEG